MERTQEASGRDSLIAAILRALRGQDLLTLHDIRVALEQEIDAAGPEAVMTLQARLTADDGWAYYPPDPLARRIHHLLAGRFLSADSRVAGTCHLAGVQTAPLAIFANHLSYADANVIEIMLRRAEGAAIAERLTAIAGPKVFTSRQRRFSSLCFGTIKVPQSTEVSSEDAVLNLRDVARAARCAIDVASARLRAADALLLFGEGTRSRTGGMQPMLAGVARYLGVPGTWVLPVGLTGSETLFPVGDPTIRPAQVTMQIGPPLRADTLVAGADGDRRLVMDAIGLAVADLLPPAYRGVYAEGGPSRGARDVLRKARSALNGGHCAG